MERWGQVEVYFHTFLISALDGVRGQLHALTALTPGMNSCIHLIGCVGPRAGLDGVGKRKTSASAGNRTMVIQSVV